jgi:outer membrane protein assembly factor BamB
MNRYRVIVALCLLGWLAGSSPDRSTLEAGDWPQILGPARNGVAANETLDGTRAKVAWRVPCGEGFAGVAVAGGTVVLFHRLKNEETLSAYDAATGQPRWSRGFPSTYRAQIVDDGGPRAVPTIHGDRVYAYGVQGRLICVALKTGAPIWNRETHQEFQAPEGYFGAGSAPLVEGDRVIVNVGGPKGAGIVAFDAATGKPVWRTTDELASYAAPIVMEQAGRRQFLVITRLQFVGLDLAGKELFRLPFGSRGPTVNGALPVVIGDHALLTASYGIGARWVDLTKAPPVVDWEDELLSSQYTTPIVHGGNVYGVDGRQDGGAVSLKCFDPRTRKVFWSKGLPEYATLIAADGKLLIQQTDGLLRVAALETNGYRELKTHVLATGTTRALPALANGLWYLKTPSELLAVDLR